MISIETEQLATTYDTSLGRPADFLGHRSLLSRNSRFGDEGKESVCIYWKRLSKSPAERVFHQRLNVGSWTNQEDWRVVHYHRHCEPEIHEERNRVYLSSGDPEGLQKAIRRLWNRPIRQLARHKLRIGKSYSVELPDELSLDPMPHWPRGDPAFRRFEGGQISLGVPQIVKKDGTAIQVKRLGTMKEPIPILGEEPEEE